MLAHLLAIARSVEEQLVWEAVELVQWRTSELVHLTTYNWKMVLLVAGYLSEQASLATYPSQYRSSVIEGRPGFDWFVLGLTWAPHLGSRPDS